MNEIDNHINDLLRNLTSLNEERKQMNCELFKHNMESIWSNDILNLQSIIYDCTDLDQHFGFVTIKINRWFKVKKWYVTVSKCHIYLQVYVYAENLDESAPNRCIMITESKHRKLEDAKIYIQGIRDIHLKNPSKFYDSTEKYKKLVDAVEIDDNQVVPGDHISFMSKENRRHDSIYIDDNQVCV